MLYGEAELQEIFELDIVHSFVYTDVVCESSLYIIVIRIFRPRWTFM